MRPNDELLRFAATGLAAYATDLIVFNVLIAATPTPSVWAKVISGLAAIAVAFAGSRWFTWRERRSEAPGREYALFLMFSLVAVGLQLLCLVFAREVLDQRSTFADNVSGNVVGMAIATVFRFWTFRTYVFPPERSAAPTAAL